MEAKGKTILVIDDVKTVLKYLQVVLVRAGYSVILAETGTEGLALFQAKSDQIDLILLDLQMPDITGFDIARTIRKTHPVLPVIAQTALSRVEDRENALIAGCTDVILKPIDMEDLREVIRKYCGE
jgi:CheY-like chemotaxis protein